MASTPKPCSARPTPRSTAPNARARTAPRWRRKRRGRRNPARLRETPPSAAPRSAQAGDVLGEPFHVLLGELARQGTHHGVRAIAARECLQPAEAEIRPLAREARILRRDSRPVGAMTAGARG